VLGVGHRVETLVHGGADELRLGKGGGDANQHFVAIVSPAPTIATFIPYSQHFVALPAGAATIETKRWLPSLPT
jgi:hypothetical protein